MKALAVETYPGTNLVVRHCYACHRRINNLADAWVDMDEDVVVCDDDKQAAEAAYPGETWWRRAAHFGPDLNDVE